jgi:hypothetical protein
VTALILDIAEELIERIAKRAAELVAERRDASEDESFLAGMGGLLNANASIRINEYSYERLFPS